MGGGKTYNSVYWVDIICYELPPICKIKRKEKKWLKISKMKWIYLLVKNKKGGINVKYNKNF